MVLVNKTVPGRRLASHALYHHPLRCPPAHPTTLTDLPALARLQPPLHRRYLPARPLGRLCPRLLAVGRLLGPGLSPLARDHPPRPARLAARPRRAAASAQPRPGLRGAPCLATTAAAGGHRPDADPLPRPAPDRPLG